MTVEQAIETLKNYECVCKYGTSPINCTDTECDFGKAIRTLIERPNGKWIEKEDYVGDTYYDCSNCGNSWSTLEGTPWQNGMSFCPNCGADMRGEEE